MFWLLLVRNPWYKQILEAEHCVCFLLLVWDLGRPLNARIRSVWGRKDGVYCSFLLAKYSHIGAYVQTPFKVAFCPPQPLRPEVNLQSLF